MAMNTFLFIYLVCNIFRTYILYRFFRIFFKEAYTSKQIEILTYILFFIVNSLIYYFIKVPVVNLLINIIGFLLLTLNYKGSVYKRLASTFLIYLTMVCIEITLAYFFSDAKVDVFMPNTREFIYIPIATTLVLYVISILLSKLGSLKSQIKIPVLYWFMLVGIPLSSLYILIILLQLVGIRLFTIALCAVLILFINFSTFYLYDMVISDLSGRLDRELLKQENIFYNHQLEQMQKVLTATRKLQHDFRNHWTTVTSYAQKQQNEELLNYLNEINTDPLHIRTMVDTGNTSIDSILNYKFQESSQMDITVEKNIQIPEKLNISASDCVIILGNLLDNAIQATNKVQKNRVIVLRLNYDRGRLLLNITNPFTGKIKVNDKHILSSKKESDLHGFGLENVKMSVEKYDGSMNINHENHIFSVSIVMFLN